MRANRFHATRARSARTDRARRSGVWTFVLLLSAAACDEAEPSHAADSHAADSHAADSHAADSDSPDAQRAADVSTRDAGAETSPGAASGGYFAIAAQVLTVDTPVSYVLTTDSIREVPDFDAAQVEVPGRALVFGDARLGALYVGGSAGPELTKYEIGAAGELTRAATLSLANQGVTAIGEYQSNMYFVSANKAYYFDSQAAQIVVWNPTDMTITDTIALEGLRREGSVLSFSSVPAVALTDRGLLIMPAAYRAADGLGAPSLTAAVIVDTEHDDASVITDSRCAYARDAVRGPDGFVYLATEVWAAALHRVAPDAAPAPCLLRIDPERRAYDPGFFKPLAELLDGDTAGSLLGLPDGTILSRVLDESATRVDDATNPRALAGEPAWGFAALDLDGEPKATRRKDAALMLGSFLPFFLDGTVYQPHFEMGTRTWLYELGSDDPRPLGAAIEGLVFSAVQLRDAAPVSDD